MEPREYKSLKLVYHEQGDESSSSLPTKKIPEGYMTEI
jgi:hypothetical protein